MAGVIPLGLGGLFVTGYQRRVKAIENKASNQEIIKIARESNGELNAVLLAEQTGISLSNAKARINHLFISGLLRKDNSEVKKGETKYFLKDNIFKHSKSTSYLSEEITDATLINLAIKNEGIISPSSVCLKLNVSIDAAKQKLEELRKKEVFITEVNENGALVYRLIDSDLIK
jgi:predicted transcriptional regulator